MPAVGRGGYTKVTLDLSGPFFQRDPGKTVRGNIRRMMEGLAEEGQAAVRDQISSHVYKRSTGWTRDHAIGRTQAYSGKQWFLHAVISANTDGMSRDDAIRTKAAASSVERRFHPFRRVATAMRSAKAVLGANLVEGIE
jgi:hypothetical protein